jgi:hypothetical protein
MSDEEKAQSREKDLRQIFGEWKSSGVQLIGSWHGCGEGVGGYAHYLILDVDDVETVYRMNRDIFRGLGGTYQRHSLDIGLPPVFEGMWESV